ncbi:MAG: hypothetical protein JSS56_25605, partial [Proteobacteria bacterium]|nr:hypothetical protein [Pseudomonadota bacterium]
MNRGNLILSGMTPAIAFIGGAYLAKWLALWPLGLKNAPLGKTPRAIDITSIRKRPTTLDVDIPSREAGRVRSGARIWRALRSPSESERIHGRGPCGIDEEPDPDMRMSIEAEGARTSSLVAVRRAQADPLYDLDLKRQVELANAQTVRELGPFPAGGMPVQIKRRPVVPERAPGAEKSREEQPFQEGEQMNLMKMAATAALAATALAGCGRAD